MKYPLQAVPVLRGFTTTRQLYGNGIIPSAYCGCKLNDTGDGCVYDSKSKDCKQPTCVENKQDGEFLGCDCNCKGTYKK